jgi:hypothetical protein
MAPLGGTAYEFSKQKLNAITKVLRDFGTGEIIKLPEIATRSPFVEGINEIIVLCKFPVISRALISTEDLLKRIYRS